MAEIKWIKLSTTMFEDEKIDFIESLPEADSILIIWVKLLALAGKCNLNGYIFLTENIPYTDEMLAHKFRRPLSVIRLALRTFEQLEMLNLENQFIKITNWSKHQNVDGMEKIREQTRNRVAKHRANEKKLLESNATCNVTVTQCNETDKDIDKDKDKDKDIKHIDSASEIYNLWSEQKNVVKSKTMDKAKINTAIKKHGAEEIKGAIKRLAQAVDDPNYYYSYKWNLYKFLKQDNGIQNWLDDGQLWQNYLDSKKQKKSPAKTKLHNFEQWTDEIPKEDLDKIFRDN